MLEGLWVIQYVGLTGHDSGSAVLVQGKVFGGDNGYVYTGTYQETEEGVSATIHIHNFNPHVLSILNIKGDYTIVASLRFVARGVLQGNASLIEPTGVGIVLKLTQYCTLN